jgi:hypothetical protein
MQRRKSMNENQNSSGLLKRGFSAKEKRKYYLAWGYTLDLLNE